MERPELIAALRRMQAETGSLVCMGCGYEDGCSVKGCALIRAAVEELEEEPWIPVNVIRPPFGHHVLATDGQYVYEAYRGNDGRWWRSGCNNLLAIYLDRQVTHWREKPEPPGRKYPGGGLRK